MSNDSPLDFFSSSAKKKKSLPEKKGFPVPEIKALSRATIDAKKIKAAADDSEITNALDHVKRLNDDLNAKIEQASAKTGKTPEEMKKIIDTNSSLSAKDKEFLKQAEKDLADKLAGPKKTPGAQSSAASAHKKNPTGDLRAKARGSKRKWMPMS